MHWQCVLYIIRKVSICKRTSIGIKTASLVHVHVGLATILHETWTRSWVYAVHVFLAKTYNVCASITRSIESMNCRLQDLARKCASTESLIVMLVTFSKAMINLVNHRNEDRGQWWLMESRQEKAWRSWAITFSSVKFKFGGGGVCLRNRLRVRSTV
jgi:hypothetical protein